MIPVPQLIMLGAKVAPYVIGAVGSFSEAAKQKKAMEEAEAQAAKSMAEARAKLYQAPLEELQVPTEAYENAMREITVQSRQLIEAARESGARELAASAGRIGAAGLQATERQREAMAEDIYKRDVAVAQDEARRLGLLSGLDVQESMGAQLAAAQAQEQRGRAITSGLTAVGAGLATGLEALPLFLEQAEIADTLARERGRLNRSILGPGFDPTELLSSFGARPLGESGVRPGRVQEVDMMEGELVPLLGGR